jgi:hypothetical protein
MKTMTPRIPNGFDEALERARADYERGYYEAVYPQPVTRGGWERSSRSESASFWLGHSHAMAAIVRGELCREREVAG